MTSSFGTFRLIRAFLDTFIRPRHYPTTVATCAPSNIHQAMVAAHGLTPPSPTLLRFLRAQLSSQTTCVPASTLRCNLYPSGKQCNRISNLARRSGSTRTISTSTSLKDAFWRKLRAQKQTKNPRNPDDLPPISGFLDDAHSGLDGRIIKPSNELKLRCTEFDENGNVTLVNGEFKKSELIAKYSLLPRDLRKIDSSVLPHILVRESAILINLLHIRCLIKHNRVLVFDVYGSTDSYAQSLFMYDLEGKLRQKQASMAISAGAQNLPYEFRALEAVLISVTSGLESEFEGVAGTCCPSTQRARGRYRSRQAPLSINL